MILTKRHCVEIESHLFAAQEERLELSRRQKDIIQRTPSTEVPGGHESGPPDPVGAAVVRLDKELRELAAWVDVVTETFLHFRGTPKGTLMAARYTEGSSIDAVCEQLFIVRQTFYNWRMDILLYAALSAAKRGVFEL